MGLETVLRLVGLNASHVVVHYKFMGIGMSRRSLGYHTVLSNSNFPILGKSSVFASKELLLLWHFA